MVSNVRKGRELQRRARAILEARGWRVETARNAALSLPDKVRPGARRTISVHHDFFGVFDCIYAADGVQRGFVQVTTLSDYHARRRKIIASGFPVGALDFILAHIPRSRRFRVLRGPLFLLTEEAWSEPAAKGLDKAQPTAAYSTL